MVKKSASPNKAVSPDRRGLAAKKVFWFSKIIGS